MTMRNGSDDILWTESRITTEEYSVYARLEGGTVTSIRLLA